ncbi:HAD family hydrolase [Gilvimarinus sp. F26214L]|uniref:HAD family hydrolase n=1 Tax=Gilvimarinus sp. DZF01 TaxID=3461371 RepID=UPI004046264D
MLYIFDWDGTLCDSLAKIVYCTQSAAAELGLPAPAEEAVKNIIGLSLRPAIAQIFPGVEEDELQALLAAYSRHFIADNEQGMDFYPGVRETLDRLHQQGHHIAIATGKSRRGLDRVLEAMDLRDYFHGSRCADETQSKPHPQMLSELLDEFGVGAEAAVMIGDTEYDMDMARRLNMPRIAVSYGAHHIDRLRPFEPAVCLDQMAELLDWKGC